MCRKGERNKQSGDVGKPKFYWRSELREMSVAEYLEKATEIDAAMREGMIFDDIDDIFVTHLNRRNGQ